MTPLRRLEFADDVESRAYWIAAGGGSPQGDRRVGIEMALLLAQVVNVLRGGPVPVGDLGDGMGEKP